MNSTYFHIFYYINKNIHIKHNNKKLIEFYNTEDIKKQIDILFEVFKYLGKKVKKTQNKKEKMESEKNYTTNNIKLNYVTKFSDDFFLNYNENKLMFSYYDENKRQIYHDYAFELKDNIYSITVSSIKNQIFICYLNERKIEVLDYDGKNNLCINAGFTNNSSHFFKCIQLTDNSLAASDNEQIVIWSENEKGYDFIKKINISSKALDLLVIEDNFFISSHPDEKSLKIYDIESFKEVKIIKNIDCVDDINCMFDYRDEYILINCNNGIGVISPKTKELVQYIEKFTTFNQKICSSYNSDFIYILKAEKSGRYNNNYTINIISGKIKNGSFKIIKEYDKFNSYEKDYNITYLNEDYLILWGNNDTYIYYL